MNNKDQIKLAEAAYKLKGSPMFKVLARANELERQGKKIIHFEIGDTDFAPPGHIIEAAVSALRSGETHYVNSLGILPLREAICEATEKELGFKPTIGQVVIAPAKAFIYFLTRCLVNPGEEVIVPDPGFASYYSVFDFIGAKWANIPLLEKNEFRMNPADVRKSITDKTRLIIINSPNNPTGMVMTKEEIMAIGEIAKEKGVYLLTDETYGKMTYDYPHYSPSVIDQCRERTIILNSFSKVYAMAGFRLGWAIMPEAIAEKIGLMIQTVFSAVPPFIQYAGIAALIGDQSQIKAMLAEYKKRRDAIVAGLNSLPGVSCVIPQGAFYAFPNITGTGLTSEEFAEFALENAGLTVLSGTNFGQYGQGYARFSYATSIDNINKAVERLNEALKNK
ncbi:MAG: hypothetical protein A3J65_04540 [Candidatus Buchananbacteria bacterium RIFCSPHIGHO2_02_FULL_45_11b]|uniref:Aminotransferase n=1 Tax=Candidatus Buchananbacteria bacterium RIFCSPHIGHO2_02_FULL_45_11b TaxID=1797541 RepID=A0A1G1YDC0_9BACT|nr:MAG: hypothetical protein A3J65_04540 [Candidatus Buchananbacteria bacterium RIFCSPHIGHO2_02_FULL_45_11b]